MSNDLLDSVRRLADGELVARVKAFALHERGATRELVAHLGELELRDLHLRAGYGSLFTYCRDALALSEGDVYNRIEVARTVRKYPAVLDLLAEGALNLTTVRLLAPYLTPENHREVLDSARGKRRAQVEEIVARLWPMPDVPPSLRKLPPLKPARASGLVPAAAGAPGTPGPPGTPGTAPPYVPAAPPIAWRPSAVLEPLSPDRYKLQVTIGGETLERLRLAKDMLRHAVPSGDDSAILDRALAALLTDLARKKFAATEQPRPSRGTGPGSRHIPADVKRAVWLRDLGRCAFVAADGRRCSDRGFLEFHHVQPFAEGGEANVGNIQLRCRRHNDYESRAYYGSGRAWDGGSVGEGEAAYGAYTLKAWAGSDEGSSSGSPESLVDSVPAMASTFPRFARYGRSGGWRTGPCGRGFRRVSTNIFRSRG